ncbi:uncharacterized protein LOC135847373 isoform X2 [Planococcus citri]|uniref:uncharacterized protein LOC135847373 isoform X2 n=1 Tax=Planococcus citri TaxID=170843 RepID=UPI0031F7248C
MGSSETKHKLEDVPENDEIENVTVVEPKPEIWLPDRFNSALSKLNDDDRKTLLFCQAVTAILNRLTPDNFPSLSGKIKQLPIDSPDRMQRIVLMIHAKAIQESKFCALYAELCDLLRDVQVVNERDIRTPFYLYLIDHCRTFFRNSLSEPSEVLEQREYILRKNSVGNCQFIGELFKVYMIHPEIIFQILDQLFQTNGDMAIECACCILTTIGFFYEEKIREFPADYLNKFESLSSTARLSSRVRFMIQDVLDLKKNYWSPKRRPELPKTSKEIEQEFIEEEKRQKLFELATAFCEYSDWLSISEHFIKCVHGSNDGENEGSDFIDKAPSFEVSVRHIIDKLTYDNFSTFSEALNELPIDDTSRLNFVIDLIFEQVISKSNSCELYAKLCSGLKNVRVPDENGDAAESTAFKTLVANKCQQLFDDSKTRELKDNTDESHQKLIVICRFIAELFKAQALHVLIVVNCVQKLSTSADEKSLECLYELLNIAGKTFWERLHRNKKAYAKLFSKVQSLLENEQCYLSPEMKSILENLLGTENLVKPKTTDVDYVEGTSSTNVQTDLSQEVIDDEKDMSTEKCSDSVITSHNVPELKAAVPNTLQKTEQTSVESHLNARSDVNSQSKTHVTFSLQDNQNSNNLNINWNLPVHLPKETRELFFSFSEILCDLQRSNFKQSIEKITSLPIDSVLRLQGVVALIVAQAIKEPECCHLYAELCAAMENAKIPNQASGDGISFRMLLINKSQREFERNKDEELEILRNQVYPRMGEKRTKMLLNKKGRGFHREMIAICRFIGELYKQRIIVARSIFRCVTKLLDAKDKCSLECLCVLLEIAGKKLEEEVPLCKKKEYESCFEKMEEILKTPVKKKIKNMLRDVIILKKSGWVAKDQSILKLKYVDHKDLSEKNISIEQIETVAKKNQEVLVCFSRILSEFKRENFVQTVKEIASLRMNNSSPLNGVVDLIFAQIIKEPENCDLYAKLCRAIHETCFRNDQAFRSIVLNKCQQEFERNKNKELEITRQQKIIKSCTNNVAKHQFELLFEKREVEFNRRSVIICRFIGELVNCEACTVGILFRCIDKLLKREEPLSLVCLCILLKTIGKNLSNLEWNRNLERDWCFDKILKLSQSQKHNLPTEIKSMLRDLISLKENGWETSPDSRDVIDDFENFFLTGVCNQVELDPESKTVANHETNTRESNESINEESSLKSGEMKDDHLVSCDGTDADLQSDSSQTFFDDEDISTAKWADGLVFTNQNVPLNQATLTSNASETTEQTVSEFKLKNHSVGEPESDIDSTSSFGDNKTPAKLNQNSDISSNNEKVLSSFSALLKKYDYKNTTDNLNELIEKMATLPIDDLPKLQSIVDAIFCQALKKYKNHYLYVELCHAMQNITVFDEKNGEDQMFRQFLNGKCMKDADRGIKEERNLADKRNKLESSERPPGYAQIKALEKKERKCGRRSQNRSRFTSELCKREMLTLDTTIHCLSKLLNSSNCLWLEGTFNWLITTAEKSELELSSNQKDQLNSIYEQMKATATPSYLKTKEVMLQKLRNLVENESKTATLNPESNIATADQETAQNLNESVIKESAINTIELKNTSSVLAENIAPNMSSKPALLSRKQFGSIESYELLRSAFDQWMPDEIMPHWFELSKYTWRRSTIPKAICELIYFVMKSDLEKAEKCGRFVVHLMKNDYITKEEIVKGLRSLFSSTVGNQQMSTELELVLSPLFESGHLMLDDLNMIFQNNEVKKEIVLENESVSKEHVKNDSQSKEVKKEPILQSKPASKDVKNDSASLQQKIPNVAEQKVVAPNVPSFFDPFSKITTSTSDLTKRKVSSFFDPFSSVTSSTSDLTAGIPNSDMTNIRPDQIPDAIRDILQIQTPSNFSSANFKRQMKNIPFNRAAELEFLASSVIKMVVNNPDLFEFYVKLCTPIMMLVAEKKKFWMLLMKACHTYFHQVVFIKDNSSSKDEPSAQFSSIAKNPKKATKKTEQLKGFCRFFSLLVNRLNNDTANINAKRAMRKLLEIRKIDLFCEIYDHLNEDDAHFEESLFESFIPELLSKNELEIEYREMLKRVADDYMNRNSQRYKSQQKQLKDVKTSEKSRKRSRNRVRNETKELIRNLTSSVWDEKSTVSSNNLDTSLNSSSSSDEINQTEPSTYSKSSSSDNLLESNASDSKLPTNQSNDTATNAILNYGNPLAASHKEIVDATVDVLNRLKEPQDISFEVTHRLTSLPINRDTKLAGVVHQICNRAIKDGIRGRQYVVLCELLQHWSIVDKNTGKSTTFKEQLITVIYTKCYQTKLKIEEYHKNIESVKEIPKELLSRVVGFCGFLCDILKSPVFGHEILICPVIELLSLDPIDKDIMGLLEELLVILTIDLDLKMTAKFSAQELKQYNLLSKMIKFLQEMIDFQKCDYGSSDPSSVCQNNATQSTLKQHQISKREELETHLKMNPADVHAIATRFKRINEPHEKLLDSVIAPMCDSFHQKWKKDEKRNAAEEFCYGIIFRSIHDTMPSFEFLCINSVFECVKRLKIPFEVMSTVFEVFFLYGIISYESFIQFKNVHVCEKLSEVMKLFNSPVFQNYKLSSKVRIDEFH